MHSFFDENPMKTSSERNKSEWNRVNTPPEIVISGGVF